ncbi:aromatic-ring-hydroxylating dioxygenase subunit beta [Caballeronia turbans]|jgi:salicylate 5-hydroxylase small subunit|uniref:Aromatic-ring-hydroxylating dioxygenase subunit beta n=1 Tax=Caballeronia cordobensis TaxID=1353886 RepID=A0A158I6E3_CABCO|nr:MULTISPECIES: aromatic-ring-hydroxylating dioxygenase subunit beta [Caballeronia]SAL42724.1 aromatic-ring-hydroxylating dioxygenase subunit beta [Caballeronia turbans]SAL52158.1 aromatic-ring-hydroxylating dioxygenase subunit beta [Caballeronia cordobensis]
MLDFETYQELIGLYAEYAAVLDSADWDRWPEFFTDECLYRVQPRENFDRGLPLATMSFESKGMLKDRVYGMTETIFHDPYYQRHVVGAPIVREVDSRHIRSEANYAVFRTKQDELTTVFNVGRYIDVIQRTPQGLRLKSRTCVFDSEMVANSLIYPI